MSSLEEVILENTTERLRAHPESKCDGEICCIHNRTDHCMREFPQHWRSDRGIMERICPHGVGHPDFDDWMNTDTIHGCDGCCSEERRATPGCPRCGGTSDLGFVCTACVREEEYES